MHTILDKRYILKTSFRTEHYNWLKTETDIETFSQPVLIVSKKSFTVYANLVKISITVTTNCQTNLIIK